MANSDPKGTASQPMSSQMQAVVRLLAGQEERTIAQKLADSNRPTWEQYKKDNEAQLNLEGMDRKKMEEYRKQLDSERDQLLSRGRNHSKGKKKRHGDGDSEDESSDSGRKHKKHKRQKKKRKRRKQNDDSSDSNDSDSSSDDRRRKRRRKHKKHKKSKSKSRRKSSDGGDSDGSHYRLSKFFDQGKSDSD
eukprot:scaffold1319_cov126-Cylindrotheca_fusiformis.AAC.57